MPVSWKNLRILLCLIPVLLLCGAKGRTLTTIAVCVPEKQRPSVKKLANDIDLELELIDHVSVKKCDRYFLEDFRSAEVDLLLLVNNAAVEIYADGEQLLKQGYAPNDSRHQVTQKLIRAMMRLLKKGLHRPPKKASVIQVALPVEPEVQTHVIVPDDVPLYREENNAKSSNPTLFLGATMGGETWSYRFTASDNHAAQAAVQTKVYPHLLGMLEWWPRPWVGVQAEGGAAIAIFRMNVSGNETPSTQNIWVKQYQGGAGLMLRYLFANGFGLGFKSGYRLIGAVTDLQRVENVTYTHIPSFQMHALELGAETYFKADRKRIEMKLFLSAMPFIYYLESPDTPGARIRPWGLRAQLMFRHFFKENWFIALDAHGSTMYGVYQGEGSRINVRGETMQGGTLLTYLVGASLGIGWAF